MSVIAKMKLDGTLDFSGSPLSKLSCVCENDLMAAYAKADEDKVFTKYSPWGEMKIASGFRDKKGNTQFFPGQKFYVVALKSATKPACAKAAHVHPCSTRVVHDFGSSKQVELAYDPRIAGSAPSNSMDENVAKVVTDRVSGMVSPATKALWMERIAKLSTAIKEARQRANMAEVVPMKVGASLNAFIHA